MKKIMLTLFLLVTSCLLVENRVFADGYDNEAAVGFYGEYVEDNGSGTKEKPKPDLEEDSDEDLVLPQLPDTSDPIKLPANQVVMIKSGNAVLPKTGSSIDTERTLQLLGVTVICCGVALKKTQTKGRNK